MVERVRRSPLYRALRVDKLTLAALEATLRACLRGAWDEVPALRMIRASAEEIGRRSEAFLERLRPQLPNGEMEIEIRTGVSLVGGGSTPSQHLPTHVLRVVSVRYSAAQLEALLRQPSDGAPVLARIEEESLVLDLRTVFPDQEPALGAALVAALR